MCPCVTKKWIQFTYKGVTPPPTIGIETGQRLVPLSEITMEELWQQGSNDKSIDNNKYE